jgi:hypothetical protein
MRKLLSLSAAALLSQAAGAQQLMVVNNTTDDIMLVDAFDGTLINPTFIDLNLGMGAAPGTVIQAIDSGTGEIWISDQTADIVTDGATMARPTRGIRPGLGQHPWDPQGLQPNLLCNAGTGGGAYGNALLEYDLAFNFVAAHAFPGSPFGIITHNGELLVSDITNDTFVRMDPANGSVLGILHDSDGINGVDFPGQLSKDAAGHIYTASLVTPVGGFEYDGTGMQLAYYDSTGVASTAQGIHPLGNGNFLLGAGNGLFLYDRTTSTYNLLVSGDNNYISPLGGGTVGTNYCNANANSTGVAASMSATGTALVSANNLVLHCSSMPQNSFCFFLTSLQQGFVQNPGGSAGNLCVAGAIGRYVGPGQIQNSGAGGAVQLAVDLTRHPTPQGLVVVQPGSTWNFTCWYRDANPTSTSNFSDGLEIMFTN